MWVVEQSADTTVEVEDRPRATRAGNGRFYITAKAKNGMEIYLFHRDAEQLVGLTGTVDVKKEIIRNDEDGEQRLTLSLPGFAQLKLDQFDEV